MTLSYSKIHSSKLCCVQISVYWVAEMSIYSSLCLTVAVVSSITWWYIVVDKIWIRLNSLRMKSAECDSFPDVSIHTDIICVHLRYHIVVMLTIAKRMWRMQFMVVLRNIYTIFFITATSLANIIISITIQEVRLDSMVVMLFLEHTLTLAICIIITIIHTDILFLFIYLDHGWQFISLSFFSFLLFVCGSPFR
jgi:hypothetical protein